MDIILQCSPVLFVFTMTLEKTLLLLFVISISAASPASKIKVSNVVSLNIQNADIGQTIPSTMHGMILETNINRDDDGGLYAELIYNRAFQGQIYSHN